MKFISNACSPRLRKFEMYECKNENILCSILDESGIYLIYIINYVFKDHLI